MASFWEEEPGALQPVGAACTKVGVDVSPVRGPGGHCLGTPYEDT